MTNTIPNVPRELPTPYELATHEGRKRDESRSSGYCGSCSIETHIAQLKDPKSWVHSSVKVWEKLGGLHADLAPSPAGVDWCKCSMSIRVLGDGCRHCQPQEYIDRLGEMLDEERAELSDAQAIIDGLRGGNADLQLHFDTLKADFDQRAQRICELEKEVASSERELERMLVMSLRLVSMKSSNDIFARLLKEARQYVAYAFSEGMDGAFTLGLDIDAALSSGKEGE